MRHVLMIVLCLLALPAWSEPPSIAWQDLQQAKAKVENGQAVVDFAPALIPLNGQPATIRGWITPFNLGDGKTVTSFLLTGTPGTCPFCLGLGAESFVLVSAAEPVPIDVATELQLSGRFEVSASDPTGFYYRLRDAKVIDHP